ncbi:hypothetical protein C1X27_19005 [Pseudomonas sp. MPR-AND1B]|nr:hypothetical protein C1X26_18960 [Pseudomonas sp. MPR-R3A]PMY97435.1 hypothetical protein C1X24_15345 [Pseudomonas sp. FW305-124]PMZ68870.1 hypothetical protein C1X25_21305 [Pseudomonas sp. GW247-3R2A]PNA90294.1 hypothetical protein C1X23_21935 [Pseudomonas sp. FW300-E2]PNB00248.1 hypothetical protein C1X27_19005 [Pseudomonas sp. MPR-AND1B]TKK42374.1 hypothetical protein PflCFBP13517_07665 [Pseudomonas fluorescens]
MKYTDQEVGAGLPAMAAVQSTKTSNLPPNGNHDAKRAALDLDLALLLISGAPLNHAGRTQA